MGRRAVALGPPLLFGFLVVALWEIVTVGAGVPTVLMPPPSSVAARFASAWPVLAADFVQTFVKAALPGYSSATSPGSASRSSPTGCRCCGGA